MIKISHEADNLFIVKRKAVTNIVATASDGFVGEITARIESGKIKQCKRNSIQLGVRWVLTQEIGRYRYPHGKYPISLF
jgi:hypothetical protein